MASDTDGAGRRLLGPFSFVICWIVGHEWRPHGFFNTAECARCWKLADERELETETGGGRSR